MIRRIRNPYRLKKAFFIIDADSASDAVRCYSDVTLPKPALFYQKKEKILGQSGRKWHAVCCNSGPINSTILGRKTEGRVYANIALVIRTDGKWTQLLHLSVNAISATIRKTRDKIKQCQ